jgi:hypothetical protein
LPLIGSADLDALAQPNAARSGQLQPGRREMARRGGDHGRLWFDVEITGDLERPEPM